MPFLFYLRDLATFAGLPGEDVPQLDYLGIQAIVALFSLAALFWLLVRRQAARGTNLLLGLLVLNGALQIVSWLGQIAGSGGVTDNARLGFLGAIIIELAFLWDLFTSGKEVTNGSSAAFPRTARVLLYLGYTVFLAASTLYFSSKTYQVSGGHVPPVSDASVFSQAGLIILGASMLVTLFLMGRGAQPQPIGNDG